MEVQKLRAIGRTWWQSATKPAGGFVLIREHAILSAWAALQRDDLELRDVRVWLAAFEVLERRLRASSGRRPSFGVEEFHRLVGGVGGQHTQAFGGFLSDVANRGLGPAMESLGLGQYVGKDPEVAVAALTNVIAPPGDTREEAAARSAINEAMAEFYKNAAADPNAATQVANISAEAMACLTSNSRHR